MRRLNNVLELLARARMDIETAALQIVEDANECDEGTIGSELLDVRARVDALEARVAVVEAQK